MGLVLCYPRHFHGVMWLKNPSQDRGKAICDGEHIRMVNITQKYNALEKREKEIVIPLSRGRHAGAMHQGLPKRKMR
jgi:hypothetical protein